MKKLRSGFTTGACAAAAAKGAAIRLLQGELPDSVEIPFPDGRRVRFQLTAEQLPQGAKDIGYAGVVKDAGDDPDVTNGALIAASVRLLHGKKENKGTVIHISGGEGVGKVTKAGLAVPVGKSAINPVPMEMIHQAVLEAVESCSVSVCAELAVEIIVPKGRELAQKTLNERLGIVGGISILGTTGIVRPISAEAWTATITASMDVAVAGGNEEIVLSTGRTSEAAMQADGRWNPEAFIMMGDYLEFSLAEAAKYPFKRLHIAGMWGKILKAALRIPQTHVRFGALQIENAIQLMKSFTADENVDFLYGSNTAREIYERIVAEDRFELVERVCQRARKYQEEISGLPVTLYLVHHNRSIQLITE